MEVRYENHMGEDLTVVNAARVSFNKRSNSLSGQDRKLIKYLASHDHFTPFTHCSITLIEKVPFFIARQRFKHTIGFSYNEVSRRYVNDDPEFFTPDMWRKAAPNKKQGSLDEPVDINPNKQVSDIYERALSTTEWTYKRLLEYGVCPEQARMVLPASAYTEYYVTGSLAAWARAYNLRANEDAQKEIRDLAATWDDIIRPLFPHSWAALVGESR